MYFLARDAYMSFITAQRLVTMNGLDIECRYLEGSRFAWRMAEYHMISNEEILDKICLGGVHVTLRKILSRGGLLSEEIEKIAKGKGYIDVLDKALSYSEAVEYKVILRDDDELFRMIRSHSIKAYDLTYDYFKQEGLLENDKIIIVDSGWVGSMQQTLERLTEKKVEGYYFGLYELPKHVERTNYHSFFFSPYKDIERKVCFSNCLYEAVFSACDGMTCGYVREKAHVIPQKETVDNPNSDRIKDNIEILNTLLEDSEYLDGIEHTSKNRYTRELQRIMSHPSKEEAEYIGSYWFSDDVNQNSLQEIAVPLTISEVRNTHALKRALIMSGHSTEKLKDSAWLEGSIVRCGKNINYHLWHCRWYKRLIYIRKCLMNRG